VNLIPVSKFENSNNLINYSAYAVISHYEELKGKSPIIKNFIEDGFLLKYIDNLN
jgi:hypothetical protein